ncbi:hypothetical protein [Nereida sp. MMG025]|uniref:hypothetical protein n=1 Tax=Nereida sp. MMG025 TaxID=2909981 RepID=UPI001F1C78CE|nr:hypothetical protein [Nereida sp. MMG025]MCF6444409.1 hypothetical protein [Nereida sp. MMG025]
MHQKITTKIAFLEFNAESGMFDARVNVTDGSDIFTYPIEIAAPITSDFHHITSLVNQKAEALHKKGAWDIRSEMRKRTTRPLDESRVGQHIAALTDQLFNRIRQAA